MRSMRYNSLNDAPVRITQTFTGIGNITIQPSRDNKCILFQLDDEMIPYSVRESNELYGTYMVFKGNVIIRQPRTDVMYVLSWMNDDDLTNLVAQLFGIPVPLRRGHAYTVHPDWYRIVA